MSTVPKATIVCLLLITSVLASCLGVSAAEGEPGQDATFPTTVHEAIDVDILGSYAVTRVTRVMENPTTEPMDHTFTFTIPEGALISSFSIEVAGTIYEAAVLEKEAAQEAYDNAVASGGTAGLVASRGEQTFEYSVCFAPLERLTAVLTYEQVLLKEHGWHEYVLPLEAGSYPAPVLEFDVRVDIMAAAEIEELAATGFDGLQRKVLVGRGAQVRVSDEDITPDETLSVRWRTGGGPLAGVLYYGEHGGSGYFLHVYDPDPALFGDVPLGKDFVFVLDRSGSMHGDKFSQAKEALEHIYGTLAQGDRFSFVQFDSHSEKYSDTLIPVTNETVKEVLNHIERLSTGGSTNIHAALMDALDIFKADGNSVPVVVLLSDGRANSGLYHRSSFRTDVAEKNTVDAPVYSIVLGRDADWDFLEALSLENDGRAIWVGEDEDIVASITNFVGTFSTPLVSRLSFDYGPLAVDVHPSQVRAHYAGSEVLVAGRFEGVVDQIPVELAAVTGAGDLREEMVFPVEVLPAHDFVPRFWAFSRIQDLEERMKYNGTDDATVREITDLAIEFHFVTDYTSLFVELPDDIQERFDATTAPEDPASSADYPIEQQSVDPPATLGYHPPSSQDSSLQFTTTTGYGQPQSMAQDDQATDQVSDPTADTSYDHSVVNSGSKGGDRDNDGLPDIEETYRVVSTDGDEPVILPGAPMKTVGGSSDENAAMGPASISGAAIAVIAMLLIPLTAVLGVVVHWFAAGRRGWRGRT